MSTPAYQTEFAPQTGSPVAVAEGIVRVTAPNGGPYTFTGTNSFLLGRRDLAVLDPGPDDARHLDALLAAIGGRRVTAILLTHTHKDHCGLARRLGAATGAPLWFGGRHRLSRPLRPLEINPLAGSCDWTLAPDRLLGDRERFFAGDLELEALATPGHCANHFAFGVPGTPFLFSGDHVMGWSSTLVAVPDGSMADYMASLGRLLATDYRTYLPAHGGPIADGPAFARALRTHREMRNGQIVSAVRAGARSIGDLLGQIYPGLSLPLRRAARMTLTAHVEALAARGELRARPLPWGWRLAPAA